MEQFSIATVRALLVFEPAADEARVCHGDDKIAVNPLWNANPKTVFAAGCDHLKAQVLKEEVFELAFQLVMPGGVRRGFGGRDLSCPRAKWKQCLPFLPCTCACFVPVPCQSTTIHSP